MTNHQQRAASKAPGLIRRAGLVIIAVFWVIQFAETSLIAYLTDPDHVGHTFPPRLVLTAVGVVVTLGLVEASVQALPLAFRNRAVASLGSAAVGCVIVSGTNYLLLKTFTGGAEWKLYEFAYVVFSWFWFLFSVAGAILALSYGIELREGDAKMAELRDIAQNAQMRALRYQLNPHFLFNTLNSIAALVARRRNEQAESMVENLADFMRTTLELDPHEDISLADEMTLQSHYLAIEAVRFPERLVTSISIPAALRAAQVPSLIMQPLIENVVKHALARNPDPVHLAVEASSANGRLHLVVRDDGELIQATRKDAGIGLANVEARLHARFDDDFSFKAQAGAERGFEARIELPLSFAR